MKITVEFNKRDSYILHMAKKRVFVWVARFLLGFLIYFLFINLLILGQYGTSTLMPVAWLINPFLNLAQVNIAGIALFIVSMLIGSYAITGKKHRK